MKKKVIVRGPALTQSGYGEHTRFVLRALRLQEEHLDIHVMPVNWGETGWLSKDDEERRWIDNRVEACVAHMQAKLPYDISVQVTIPNEWQRMAAVNIGVTAGIESNRVSPHWIQKVNEMDKVITISEHSKRGFTDAAYQAQDAHTGQPVELRCTTPVEVVGYPVKAHKASGDPVLELDYDFNILAVAQWGPRKNLANLIKWFVEENVDQEVGLVVKTSIKNNSIVDRFHIKQMFENCIPDIPDRKCKVYLLHGDMSEAEMHALYEHPKIKAVASLSHGEGFGLPLFEAAYSGLPVIAPGWSGQVDFLYAPSNSKAKKNKNKMKAHFAEVDYTIGPVSPEAVWPGVVEKDTMWCYPTEGSFKLRMRQVRNNYNKWLKKAKTLQKWVREEFGYDKMHEQLSFSINTPDPALTIGIEELPKISIITSVYDGDEYIRPFLEDITRQSIFEDKCELILINANSPGNEEEVIQEYLDKYPDNIIYKRLDKDPGIYGVWNKAVGIASGEYLTNANLDDRKAINSLERHARELCTNDDVELVYADMIITDKPNESFEMNSSEGRRYNFPDFSLDNLKMTNMPHASPMWRKSYHDKYGLFDPEFRSAGDWEMWLRGASQGSKFKKIDAVLGLYYFNPKGISTNPENFSWKREEEMKVFKKYKVNG